MGPVSHMLSLIVLSKLFARIFVHDLEKRLAMQTSAIAVSGVGSEHWASFTESMYAHNCAEFAHPIDT